jgi:hypothetical protein
LTQDKEQIKNLQNLLDSTKEMWAAMAGSIVAGVVEKYGEEGRKIVRKAVFDACKWQTEKRLKEAGIIERGIMALAKHGYPAEGAHIGDHGVFDMEHAHLDQERFDLKVNFCPYVKTWRETGIIARCPDLCDLLTTGDYGVSSVFTPTLHLKLTKCMTRGDDYCIYSWTESKRAPKRKPARKS